MRLKATGTLRKKVQGPFRSPEEVRVQRLRPLRPSLRVMSDFDAGRKAHVAEMQADAVRRIHPERWRPQELRRLFQYLL